MEKLGERALLGWLCCALWGTGCRQEAGSQIVSEKDPFLAQREWMVERQLAGRDIVDEQVLRVMRKVPRHRFVPGDQCRTDRSGGEQIPEESPFQRPSRYRLEGRFR